ncbi:uncharacterized protein [Diadema antillarum]|uniref:uncharacterized protein n=1 Tax=Diadema antillarum TaxID=105358 RepID=UPI003A8444F0
MVSQADRGRIILWWAAGASVRVITKKLHDYGVEVSKTAVANCIKRYRETGSVSDRPRSGRPHVLTAEEEAFIDQLIDQDKELSSIEIQAKVQERFGKGIGASTIRSIRKNLGWTRSRVLYGQLIRNYNKASRLSFSLRMYETDETFRDVIYTDESTFWVENNARHYYRRLGTPNRKVGKPKHPYKVHVYPDGCRLMMDNDPKHTSAYAANVLERNNVTWWRTPPESPDINPIEHVWGNMKVHIRRHVKPRTKEQLIDGLKTYWRDNMTRDKLERHLNNVYNVYPEIIRQMGDTTKY